MAVPILDLTRQHLPLKSKMLQAIEQLIDTNQFVLGKTVADFEQDFATYNQAKHAIGVSSGTDALLIAMMALDLQAGDEIISTPFTFFATAGTIARSGAKPVFIDIDPITFNLDVGQVEAAITPRTRAILPVHLFGLSADMVALREIANRHHLPIIEDVAQAIGATEQDEKCGTMGTIGCFSFYPTKNLSACGDAGAVLTNDDQLATKLTQLRMHGETSRYHHAMVGGNFRIDAIQARILQLKLSELDRWTNLRRENANRYKQLLDQTPLILPTEPADKYHVYHQYTVRVPAEKREALVEHLKEHQIGFGVFYPVPMHLQPCFASLGGKQGDHPHAEQAAQEVISLPIFPGLTEDEIQEVSRVLIEFFK